MKEKNRIQKWTLICGIVTVMSAILIFTYLFVEECDRYRIPYYQGNGEGVVFVDCEHTEAKSLRYDGTSAATREPIYMTAKELQEIHPTLWSYMSCCGQIQKDMISWSAWLGVPTIAIVSVCIFLNIKHTKTECALDKS